MITLKVSMFVCSLGAAAVIGGMGTTMVINMTAPEITLAVCKSAEEDAFLKKRRSGVIINSGPAKEY